MGRLFVIFICFAITVERCQTALPSVCLNELIRPSSGQCCSPQPVIEIGFYLRFGCDVPTALDEGVRLEFNLGGNWLPIRFYTPSLNQSSDSLVTIINSTAVNAQAFGYNSDFRLHFMNTTEPVLIREYLCGSDYTTSNSAVFRWMQQYSGISQRDVSTWSIDSVTISVWDGTCLKTVVQEDFNSAGFVSDVGYRAGNITEPPCGPTHSGTAIYFDQVSEQENPRRSFNLRRVDLTGASVSCQTSTSVDNNGECTVSNSLCDSDDIVCSLGSFQCGSCPEGRRLEGVACEDINECTDGSHSCQGVATCINTPGSYQCNCPNGYRLGSDGTSCQEINECKEGTHNCQGVAICTNTQGSYQCSCPTGYIARNITSCEDINECEGIHNCEGVAVCVNTDGSFRCDCPVGYNLRVDGRSCEDINECATSVCQGVATCINTPGSFQCNCPIGYRLSRDNVSCEDINECTDGSDSCQGVAECRNTVGSYHCDCPSGYRLSDGDRFSCEDINECADLLMNNCRGVCTNTPGSFVCGCPSGYVLGSDGTLCEDINECTDNTHSCPSVATCVNTPGSYQCNCTSGYRWAHNSSSCEDINECVEGLNNCEHECTNTPGSFDCSCLSGYSLSEDRTTCQDINECDDESIHNCPEVAICVNIPGSYQCSCRHGYRQNDQSCEDIDECSLGVHVHGCEHECTNIPGSFVCSCRDGYYLMEDQTSCHDVDECEGTNDCQGVAVCENTPGSYQCNCPSGYRMTLNGLTCEEIPSIVIGFEQESYTVREETNSLTICLQLKLGDITTPIPLVMNTIDGTATAGVDYISFLQPLTFSTDTTSMCADVSIIDDSLDEGFMEFFDVEVTHDGEETIVLEPITTRVVIVEQDGAVQIINEIEALIGTVNSSEVVNVLKDLLTQQLKSGEPASREFSELFLGTTSNLLSQLSNEQQIELGAAEDVLNLLDTFALQLYDETQPDIATDKFALNVKRYTGEMNIDREVGIRMEGEGEITLPQEFLAVAAENATVKVASFFFNDLSDVLPNTLKDEDTDESMIGSPVISSTLGCGNESCPPLQTSDPVQIVLKKKEIGPNYTEPGCFFYSLTDKAWSSEGCEVNEEASNDTFVVCNCYHLTHFAILLSPNLNVSEGHKFALQVIGYVFGSISFVCLILTVAALMFLRTLWGMRNYIHINLCINLFIAQLIFVIAVDKTGNEKACQGIAVILHYFFLVTFMWMLMEGVVLYVALVRVFIKKQKLYMIAFTVASYGLPLLYMCLVVPLGLVLKGPDGKPHYGNSEACWLRYDTNFIWAFIAPVILIIMANIGFFFMAVCIMYKHEKKGLKKTTVEKVSHWLKTSISLLVIMGITWIVGVLVFHEALLFIGYIFTIMVACQGLFIFILFVPVSKQVRESYKKWWRSKVSESEFLSRHFSSSDGSGRRISRLSSLRTSSFRMSRFSFRSSRYDPEMQISRADSVGTRQGTSSPPLSSEVKVELKSFSRIDESVADNTTSSYTQDTCNGGPSAVSDHDRGTNTSNGVLTNGVDSLTVTASTDNSNGSVHTSTSNGGVTTNVSEKQPSHGETSLNGVVTTSVEGTDSTEVPTSQEEKSRNKFHVTFSLPKETFCTDGSAV